MCGAEHPHALLTGSQDTRMPANAYTMRDQDGATEANGGWCHALEGGGGGGAITIPAVTVGCVVKSQAQSSLQPPAVSCGHADVCRRMLTYADVC